MINNKKAGTDNLKMSSILCISAILLICDDSEYLTNNKPNIANDIIP